MFTQPREKHQTWVVILIAVQANTNHRKTFGICGYNTMTNVCLVLHWGNINMIIKPSDRMRTDIAEICRGVHHAQLCRKSLSYTSKLKPKHRWWKYTSIFRSMQFSLLSCRVSPLKLIPNTKIYCRMATHVFCHYWQWKVMSKFVAIIAMDAIGLLEEKLHTDYLHTLWLVYWLS